MNTRNNYDILLSGMFIWGAISSVVIAVLVRGGLDNKLIFGLKDAVIYFIAVAVVFRVFKDRDTFYSFVFIFMFVAYLIANYFLLNHSYGAPLNNIRQIVSPMALMVIFLMIFRHVSNYSRLSKLILLVHTLIFIFGVFEVTTEYWKEFDLHRYFSLKGISVDSYGISYMFYEPMLGNRLRMTSTMIDPISAGHYFSTMLCFAWFVPVFSDTVKKYLILSSLVGVLLCFSKGSMLQAFLMLFVFNHRIFLGIRVVSIILPFIAISVIPNIDGLLIHFKGVYQSLITLSFWGHGIGSSGNYASMFSDDTALLNPHKIGDTFLGALLGQIGVFGLFSWLFFMLRIVYIPNSLVPLKLMASILMVSSMSENTLNVTSFVLPALLVAWSYAYFYHDGRKVYFATANNKGHASPVSA